jgi:hypothetical protein
MSSERSQTSQAPVAHACNPSYSGGRDQENRSLKPAQANSSWDPIMEIPNTHTQTHTDTHTKSWQECLKWKNLANVSEALSSNPSTTQKREKFGHCSFELCRTQRLSMLLPPAGHTSPNIMELPPQGVGELPPHPALGLELRTSHLLGRHSTTWATPQPFLLLFIYLFIFFLVEFWLEKATCNFSFSPVSPDSVTNLNWH